MLSSKNACFDVRQNHAKGQKFLDPAHAWRYFKTSMGESKINTVSRTQQRVEVQILGQRMNLKAEADPRYLERLANYVKRKVEEVSQNGPVSSSKIAILAALNIADDYFKAMEENREFKRKVADKSRAMLRDLDS
ncbi:MAG: cell division protein ZapA [Myxococcota bacterium]|jgi:cell division protein ZapA|nr:cell division protein ZapA [Myxococcota bacterium]